MKWRLIIWSAVASLLATGSVQAQTLGQRQRDYQQTMVNYRSQIGQFERDKLIYQRGGDASYLETVMASGQASFVTRRQAVSAFIDYLRALVETYVTDQTVATDLLGKLAAHQQVIDALPVQFSSLGEWSEADNAFASAYAALNETAYQTFAQIYWTELHEIVETYVTLYQNQNQRILREASSQIERERKAAVLAESERALEQLQAQSEQIGRQLASVNSAESYNRVRDQLNTLLSSTETSLRAYASLE